MRKFIFVIALVAAAVLTSCKTTEANYRAAYDVAKARQIERQADDDYDDETKRLLARNKERGVTTHIIGNDTIKVTTLFVKMTYGTTDRVPRYSVVLNQFSQIFNAKAMCNRLRENGYPDAYVFQSATPEYFVAASGSNDINDMVQMLRFADNTQSLGTRQGFPKVICSGGWRPK